MIHARTSLCADAEVLASVRVEIHPCADDERQRSIIAICLPGITIQSHAMEAGEFAAWWDRIADDVRSTAGEWERTEGVPA